MVKSRLIKHSNLSGKIYQILKDQITHEELKPGQRLLDDQLASMFGVSRTPVREALARLSTEGLVKIVPRGGVYVKKLTREDVEDIYEVRKVLEGLAARKAASLMTDKKIEKLAALFEKARCSKEKDYKPHIDLDVKLHDAILKSCRNQKLSSIMENLYTLIHVFRVRVGKDRQKAEKAFGEHVTIFEAIKKRDAREAERAMIEHIKRSKKYILDVGIIKQKNDNKKKNV